MVVGGLVVSGLFVCLSLRDIDFEAVAHPVSQSLGVTFVERVLDGLVLLFMLVLATFAADVPVWTS